MLKQVSGGLGSGGTRVIEEEGSFFTVTDIGPFPDANLAEAVGRKVSAVFAPTLIAMVSGGLPKELGKFKCEAPMVRKSGSDWFLSLKLGPMPKLEHAEHLAERMGTLTPALKMAAELM